MSISKSKVKLSPRLQMGVGRGGGYYNNIFKYGTAVFLFASAALLIRAGYMVVNHSASNNPQVLGVDTQENSETESKPLFIEYKVAADDTLFSISQKYNIEWTTLATLNNLKAPFALKPGQVLKIPTQ